MPHHQSSLVDQELLKKMLKEETETQMHVSAEDLGLGPTGEFPDGKLTDQDEGEIKIAITHYKGRVVLNFGSPVAFIGFIPEQAVDIANTMIAHSEAARKENEKN